MYVKFMKRIGMIADTHGRDSLTREAARLLVTRQVDALLHLGDVGSRAVLDALVGGSGRDGRRSDRGCDRDHVGGKGAESGPQLFVVFGNMDYDLPGLSEHAVALGLNVVHPVGRLESNGKLLVFQHGHLFRDLESAIAAGVDYLCHGHTHKARDERIGRTRVLNPGALFRARLPTVGLLDMSEDTFEVIAVGRA